MGAAENFVDVLVRTELGTQVFGLAFVSESELVLEVGEAVVHRGCREHEHLRLHALPNHLIEQTLIPRLPLAIEVVVAEVVRLINDHEVVVAPIHPIERHTADRVATLAKQIRVAQHVVVETILGEDVRDKVAFVGRPVIRELLRAEHEDRPIAQLVVFDDCEGGEGLPEAHAVGENTAVIGFELVDDSCRCVPLEIEELLPDEAVLIPRKVIWQHVRAEVFQKLAKDVVEHREVDALRRIFLIYRRDVLAEFRGHVLQLFRVVPNLVEKGEVGARHGLLLDLVHEV